MFISGAYNVMSRLRNPGYEFGEICVYKLIASHLHRPMWRNYHAKFTQLITKIPKLINVNESAWLGREVPIMHFTGSISTCCTNMVNDPVCVLVHDWEMGTPAGGQTTQIKELFRVTFLSATLLAPFHHSLLRHSSAVKTVLERRKYRGEYIEQSDGLHWLSWAF